MIEDKELVQKLKPELKKFNLTKEQRITIAIIIKRNPQFLDKCLEYLKNEDAKADGEDIQKKIVEICY